MTIKINGVTITNNNSDFIETNERTKALDTGRIVLNNDTKSDAYDVDSEVEVIIGSTSRYFVSSLPTFERTSRNPDSYRHTLELVEVTKKLEGIIIPNRTFRQPLDGTLGDGVTYSIYDELESIRQTADFLPLSDTNFRWEWDTSVIPSLGVNLETYLDAIKARQLTINKPTAREALDQIFKQENMEARMIDFSTVGTDFINSKGNQIDLTKVSRITGSQSLEQYADRIDYFLENAISESNLNKQAIKYPSVAWASVRGSSSFLTSDNFIFELPENIEEILKVEIYAEITSTLAVPGFSETIKVDITEQVFEEKAWESLEYVLGTTPGNAYFDTIGRNNTIYFKRGDNKILGFHEEIDKFLSFLGTYYSYRHLLSYAASKGQPTPRKDSELDNFEEFMFRVTYVPRALERYRVERNSPLGTRSLQFNQDERIIDIEKLGRKATEDVERLGNKKKIYWKRVTDYADAFNINDYDGDYIGEKVVNTVDKGEVISEIHLSKDAPTISLDVGVNTENRDTQIDADNAVIRQELYNEYMELSYSSNTNDSMVTEDGLARYAEVFNNDVPLNVQPVEMVEFSFQGINERMLQCGSKGAGKVIKFDFGFDSPNIAGKATKLVDGLWTHDFPDYVNGNVNARLSEFQYRIIGTYKPIVDNVTDNVDIAQALPRKGFVGTVIDDVYITSPAMRLLKDGGEILKVTHQVTHVDAEGDIFIGDRLSTENPLVVQSPEAKYIVLSDTPLPERQQLLATDYDNKYLIINTGTPGVGEIKLAYVPTADNITITLDDVTSTFWGMVNGDDQVYFLVGNTEEREIKFNPRKNRS